jgi:hypothetical protein
MKNICFQNTKIKSCLVIFLIVLCNAAKASVSSDELVDKMVEQYRSISTYSDSGTVEAYVHFGVDAPRNIDSKKFSTNHDANEFKLEWSDFRLGFPVQKNSVNSSEKGFVVTAVGDPPELVSSASTALSMVEGVSGGIAFLAPRFLMKEISCKPSLGAISTESLGNEVINGRDAYVVQLMYNSGRLEKLWIDMEQLFLHRVERNDESPIGRMQTVIKYSSISIDGKSVVSSK